MLYFDDLEFDENEFTIYIIEKYLKKYFKKGKIKELKSNYSPKQIARFLGEKDLAFFCLYYLKDFFVASDENYNYNIAPLHLDIWQELTDVFSNDKWDKELFEQPRGSAKSTVINKALSVWCVCYKKSRYTIVLGNKESDASSFIEDTRMMLENRYIVEEFGILVNPRTNTVNRLEVETTNNCKIQAFSWGSSVRGSTYGCQDGLFRPQVIILDDILKEDDILSDNAKEKVVNKFYKEVLEVGEKELWRKGKKVKSASKFLILGTPLSSDDFLSTIRNDPSFRTFHRSVCDFNVDEYFKENTYWQKFKEILFDHKLEDSQSDAIKYYENNFKEMQFETIWEKYNCLDLAITYFTKRLTFMQELMCDCVSVGEQWINHMILLPNDEIENKKFDKTILSIDPSSSKKIKSDYTAMTVLSKSGSMYYVRSGFLSRFDAKTEFDKYIDTVIDILHFYRDITHVFIEKNVFKGIDESRIKQKIREDTELNRRNITVMSIYNNSNKDQRISTIIDKINSGQCVFNENDKEYNKQVREFRGQYFTVHDDSIDSLEMALNNIDKIKVTKEIKILPFDTLF